MTEPASLEELLEFVNKVRVAGGAEPIDKLMPGKPGKSKQCLIARNLNFSCSVHEIDVYEWAMRLDPTHAELAKTIAEAINCTVSVSPSGRSAVSLPDEIGALAEAFDRVHKDPDKEYLLPYVC